MPAVSVSRGVAAPPGRVWALLSDIEKARRWNAAWASIEFLSAQHHGMGTIFRARAEDGNAFDFEITGWEPGEHIAFAPLHPDDWRPYPITLESHSFHLAPAPDGGTAVTLTAVASLHGLRGLLAGRFFWRGHQKAGLEGALDAVEEALEVEGRAGPEAEASRSTD